MPLAYGDINCISFKLTGFITGAGNVFILFKLNMCKKKKKNHQKK